MRTETLLVGSRRFWALAWLACSVLLCSARPAAAQENGFAIDRFEPSERGSEWFVLDTLDLRGHLRPAIGLVADYGYKPLVIYDGNGNEVGPLIKHQLFLHVGASLVLWERLRLAASLPFSPFLSANDSLVGRQQYNVNSGPSIGDLRLSADVRLFGKYRGPASLAIGASVWLPTGSRDSYAGDGKVRVSPHAMLAGEIARFSYAVRAAFQYRAQNGVFAGSSIGSEITFGAALGVRVLKQLLIGPELYGSTVVEDGAFKKRGTPLEGIFGGHYTIARQVRIGAGAGMGFTQGLGSPEVRVLANVEWAPQTPEDRDGDGILDDDDACPDEPGVRSDDPTKNGCPIRDRDQDGILDEDDACPDVAGPRNDDPSKNGCPPARIERGQIRILEQIQFKFASAEILPISDGILSAVLQILEEHPEITQVSVEGHTDNVGSAKFNKDLSEQRVRSVLSWLTSHGVQPIRLTSRGFGLEQPIAPNDTEQGRAQNRRVEFHIKTVDNKPVGEDGRPLDDAEQE